jgi:hypothetical protein
VQCEVKLEEAAASLVLSISILFIQMATWSVFVMDGILYTDHTYFC